MMRMQREHFTVKYKDSDYLNCFGVIYLITNIVNNKIYVGQSVNFYKRVKIHERTSFNKKNRDYNHPLYKAIRKYGIVNFEVKILKRCSSLDELNSSEIFYIKTLDSIIDHGKGYNLEKGGHNGLKSEFTKAKMRKSQGGINSPSYNKRCDDALRAIKIIDLDTAIIYGSMIDCAIKLFNEDWSAKNRKVLKSLSRLTNIYSNRLSYKGKHFARVDKFNNVYIKTSVADLLNIEYDNANGKSYIIISLDDLLNKLSKKA